MATPTCYFDGKPARYEFLAAKPSHGLDERWEPICGECRDNRGFKYTRDTCYCDEDEMCGYHAAFCSLCERRSDGLEPGPLCKTCRATARNAAGPYDRQRHLEAWRFDRCGRTG